MKIRAIMLLFVILLTGCTEPAQKTEIKPLNVDLQVEDGAVYNTNELITFIADVTYGEDSVKKADEVVFEVRNSDQLEGEMIPATNHGDGTYSIEKTFTEKGDYVIISHVTAENLHNMPLKKFKIQ